jgi:hypothetical protein
MQEIRLGQVKAGVKLLTSDGVAIEVRKPTAREVIEYEAAFQAEGADKVGALFAYLEKLGVPRAVAEGMTFDELQELAEALAPKKK